MHTEHAPKMVWMHTQDLPKLVLLQECGLMKELPPCCSLSFCFPSEQTENHVNSTKNLNAQA